jgi:DNA-binding HxlR family transcriptional regulator
MDNSSTEVCDPRYGEVDNILEQLTKSKALHILMILDRSNRPVRFTELKEILDAPSTTVSRRLKELEDCDLIQRVKDDEGRLTLYGPTEDTETLSPIMESLFDWVSVRFERNSE